MTLLITTTTGTTTINPSKGPPTRSTPVIPFGAVQNGHVSP
jgi:hypothetical protein